MKGIFNLGLSLWETQVIMSLVELLPKMQNNKKENISQSNTIWIQPNNHYLNNYQFVSCGMMKTGALISPNYWLDGF